jgi:thiol-disulfide isomerase/thioredoxin
LVGFSTPEALRIYADILAKDPDYPWVHYSLLEIYRSAAFRDRAKLRSSFDTLTRVCPRWIEPYQYLTALDDDALAAGAAWLRTMLEATQNPRDLKLYSTLWSAEFRVLTKADGDAAKRRVAADLKRLREIGGVDATIAYGARLIGDTALVKEMTPARKPDVGQESNEWLRTHPRPAEGAAPDKKRAYGEDFLRESEKWIAMAPESIIGYSDRLRALIDLGAPAGELAKALDDLLKIAETGESYSGFTFVASLARRCVEQGVLLDRVPEVIEEALTKFDDPEGEIEIDLSPSVEMTRTNRMNRCAWHVGAVVTLSMYYGRIGQMEKARAVLAPVPAVLAAHPRPAGVQDLNLGHNLLIFYAQANYSYWKRLGEVDERESRIEDALTDYREALLAFYIVPDTDLLVKSRRLWKDLGRSDEAWQTWVDSIPKREHNHSPTFAFVPSNRALPKIALKDLDGNEWKPDRFTSKTTLAVVWATWCAPCVQELPYFAKLADRLKDLPNVQVVSFNTDDNPELAKSFIEKSGYKFPVLIAKNFAEDLMPYLSIPRTWIIRNGAIVKEAEGSGLSGDQWLDRVVAELN